MELESFFIFRISSSHLDSRVRRTCLLHFFFFVLEIEWWKKQYVSLLSLFVYAPPAAAHRTYDTYTYTAGLRGRATTRMTTTLRRPRPPKTLPSAPATLPLRKQPRPKAPIRRFTPRTTSAQSLPRLLLCLPLLSGPESN